MYVQEHGESGLVGSLEGPTGLSGEVAVAHGWPWRRSVFLIEDPRRKRLLGRGQRGWSDVPGFPVAGSSLM